MAGWSASGLTVRDFCRRRRLTETSFHYWRRELRRRGTPTPSASPAFVPVTVLPAATVEVRCPSGHVVTVPAADGETLRRVFAALAEGPSC
jgi:transposase